MHFLLVREPLQLSIAFANGTTQDNKVPLEKSDDAGSSRDSHWRQSVFKMKLWIPTLNLGNILALLPPLPLRAWTTRLTTPTPTLSAFPPSQNPWPAISTTRVGARLFTQ